MPFVQKPFLVEINLNGSGRRRGRKYKVECEQSKSSLPQLFWVEEDEFNGISDEIMVFGFLSKMSLRKKPRKIIKAATNISIENNSLLLVEKPQFNDLFKTISSQPKISKGDTNMKSNNNDNTTSHGEINGVLLLDIPINEIRPFPNQPRTEFDNQALTELKGSIAEIGQQQAITVRKITDGEFEYELIDGERRYRACVELKKTHMRAIVEIVNSNVEQFMKSVVANFCREGHTPLETAHALNEMVNSYLEENDNPEVTEQMAIEYVMKICGKSVTWVRQHLGLLKLCKEVREYLSEKKISFQVATALINFQSEFQIVIAKHIILHDLSQKRALQYIRDNASTKTLTNRGRKRSPSQDYKIINTFLTNLGENLSGILNTDNKKFEAMFENRTIKHLSEFVESLEEAQKDMEQLIEIFKNILLEREKKKI